MIFHTMMVLLFPLLMLSNNIRAFSVKKYDILHVSNVRHGIIKHGTTDSDHPFNKIHEIHFNTHGQDFRLILSPNRDILHSNFKAFEIDENGNEQHFRINHENFYSGRVFGESSSNVKMHIDNGILSGTIEVPDETYHIEPSWRHIPDESKETMIVYKQSNVELEWNKDGALLRTCGYITDQNNNSVSDNEGKFRSKRQLLFATTEFVPIKTRCSLLLVADYTFYKYMGGASTKTTINYLINLIDRVHKIYNSTIWRDNPFSVGFQGMGFLIKQIMVHNAPSKSFYGEEHYNMERYGNKWNVRHLLEVFSRNNANKDFCLAHLFTHQTFKTKNSVVLGLAYIASPRKSSHGGICTKEFIKDGYRVYLNSGLSSSSNYNGQRVITREAELVTAHEFGHNWGSEHDPDMPECSPSSRNNGSYLMYSYSVSGYDKNNRAFSPCSIRSIRKVLIAKSESCFSVPEKSFCGNSKVENSEECDAGLFGTDLDSDPCCDRECKLRPGAVCSDKNSICCQNCRFLPKGTVCRDAQYSTCEEQSVCTGRDSNCPSSPFVRDGQECQEKGKCHKGQCVPFCETLGFQSCMCDNPPDACKRCCRSYYNGTCLAPDANLVLQDGTPCMYGICMNGRCEKTRPEFVERFWHLIDTISINKIFQFFRDNIVGSVVIVTATIWLPSCYLINKIDKKRKEEVKSRTGGGGGGDEQFFNRNDVEQVIRVKVPRRTEIK